MLTDEKSFVFAVVLLLTIGGWQVACGQHLEDHQQPDFTAGAADQVSTWYNEKKHGLFTYYFLKGLRGAANADGDQAVTAWEMEAYLIEKVPYRAQRMHSRTQTPQVVGKSLDRVLVRLDDR
jgi:hypothetical protein